MKTEHRHNGVHHGACPRCTIRPCVSLQITERNRYARYLLHTHFAYQYWRRWHGKARVCVCVCLCVFRKTRHLLCVFLSGGNINPEEIITKKSLNYCYHLAWKRVGNEYDQLTMCMQFSTSEFLWKSLGLSTDLSVVFMQFFWFQLPTRGLKNTAPSNIDVFLPRFLLLLQLHAPYLISRKWFYILHCH